jgi:hypothetical protein
MLTGSCPNIAQAEPGTATTPAPATSSLPPDAPIDVKVVGRRPDPGQTTVAGSEVRQIPGAFGDAFRIIEALPGATPMASGLPYFFIRGAPPGNTGFFIDGVQVPLLFHAAFGPSVIHPGLIDRVDYFPGVTPAELGRFAGGVLSATAPPPSPTARAEGNIRLFDAGALAETPFGDGRGSALVAGRYSYSGLIVSALSPIKLAYWDYQTRATWKLDDKNTVGVLAFGSHDNFGQVVGGVTDTILNGDFHRVDMRLDHALDDGTLRIAATLGYSRSNNDNNDIRDLSAGVRANLEERLAPTLIFRAGGDLRLDRYDLLADTVPNPFEQAETTVLYPPHLDVAVGGYAEVAWQVTPRVQLVPGLRADLFTSHRTDDPHKELAAVGLPTTSTRTSILPALDPRISARVALTPKLALISTFGVAHEPPTYLVPVPGLTFVEPEPVLQTAVQLSEGVVVALPQAITVQMTGFLHSYLDLTDLTATCPSVFGSGVLLGNAPNIMNSSCIAEHVRGRAFGGELSLRRNLTKRLSGWLSYTLSRSTRETNAVGPLGHEAPIEVVSAFDRTHAVSVVATYDLGAHWRVGLRFVAYSGLPYSNTRDYVPVAPFNGERMPAFYRFDVRVEKKWWLTETASISLVLEGMNVTFNKEVLGVHCQPEAGHSTNGLDTCTYQTLGPVAVPSVGVEASF